MQGRIANAVLRFRYADGQDEKLELIPPFNFWTLCPFGGTDYDYARDAFCLPRTPPPQVQLGKNCRAMIYSWKLRTGVTVGGSRARGVVAGCGDRADGCEPCESRVTGAIRIEVKLGRRAESWGTPLRPLIPDRY